MATPHKCPVCDDTGKVSRPPYVAGDQPTWEGTSIGTYPCPACHGTGIIWEANFTIGPTAGGTDG